MVALDELIFTVLTQHTSDLNAERAYDSWQDMLEGERGRDDRVEIVTVATPNDTHFEISKGFLEAGFHVLCEKPLTMTIEQAEEIGRVARAAESMLIL